MINSTDLKMGRGRYYGKCLIVLVLLLACAHCAESQPGIPKRRVRWQPPSKSTSSSAHRATSNQSRQPVEKPTEQSRPQSRRGREPGPDIDPKVENRDDEGGKESSKTRAGELKKFFDEWDKYMKNFSPVDLVNFELGARSQVQFIERVEKVPAILKGAYSVSAKTRPKIKLVVYDPSSTPILIKDEMSQAVLYYLLQEPGEYVLEFSNNNVSWTHVKV